MCDRVFFCFSEEPLTGEEFGRGRSAAPYARFIGNDGRFSVSMCDAAYQECPCCCAAANPLTFTCTQMYMRHAVLNHVAPGSNWDHYVCCAGYFPTCPCFQPGQCCEKELPRTCMCLEAWLCPGLAVSSTRFLLMEHYSLAPDPCDNRLVRANNCLQLLACVCDIAAHFDRNLRELSALIDCAADLVFLSTAGCMIAQVHHEMKYRSLPTAQTETYSAVATVEAVPPLSVETIKR
mmetsp:Transcript_1905/g.5746  ORF Transcript_1905/g.5746 Transcript_1905/m.5746 type:complete len:235 (+) Transcript_1905:102-806(+)